MRMERWAPLAALVALAVAILPVADAATQGWNPPWTQPTWNTNYNWNTNYIWNPPWTTTQPHWSQYATRHPTQRWTQPPNWAPTTPTHWAPTPPTHWAPTPPTHWASTPNHQPTPATSSKTLYSTNAAGCGSKGCVQCEGDCDSDADCAGSLTCFKRDGLESVPGCGSGGLEGEKACILVVALFFVDGYLE